MTLMGLRTFSWKWMRLRWIHQGYFLELGGVLMVRNWMNSPHSTPLGYESISNSVGTMTFTHMMEIFHPKASKETENTQKILIPLFLNISIVWSHVCGFMSFIPIHHGDGAPVGECISHRSPRLKTKGQGGSGTSRLEGQKDQVRLERVDRGWFNGDIYGTCWFCGDFIVIL